MADTIVNVIGFEDFIINIVDQSDTFINKKAFDELVIIVPGEGGDTGIFDFTFDDTFE